jgi:hypothetical protein
VIVQLFSRTQTAKWMGDVKNEKRQLRNNSYILPFFSFLVDKFQMKFFHRVKLMEYINNEIILNLTEAMIL